MGALLLSTTTQKVKIRRNNFSLHTVVVTYKAGNLVAYKAGHLAAYKATHPSIWVRQ